MALQLTDDVEALADELASLRSVSKSRAVKDALRNELARTKSLSSQSLAVLAHVRELHERYPPTGETIDKAFIDSLYED